MFHIILRLTNIVYVHNKETNDGWLVVLGFNATLTAKVQSWWSVMHMCFLAFSKQHKHNFLS